MLSKVKGFMSSNVTKVGAITTGLICASGVLAHADTVADSSAVTTSLTSGFADTKTIFLVVIGVAVTAGIGFFAIKFAITQGINFFAKIAKK